MNSSSIMGLAVLLLWRSMYRDVIVLSSGALRTHSDCLSTFERDAPGKSMETKDAGCYRARLEDEEYKRTRTTCELSLYRLVYLES